jgi:cytochrome b6-f complex iron-sulfur subunit
MEKAIKSQDQDSKKTNRRSFLGKLAVALFSIGIIGQGWTYFRSLVPNILYEPPKRFKIGKPGKFAEGVNFLEDQRVYILRKGKQYSCISGKCTHLGCTVKMVPLETKQMVKMDGKEVLAEYEFRCPCHGSKFRQNGQPYSGPAPSALPWHKIEVAPEDGQLIVDISTSINSNDQLLV